MKKLSHRKIWRFSVVEVLDSFGEATSYNPSRSFDVTLPASKRCLGTRVAA